MKIKLRNKTTGEICEFMIHKRIENSKDGNPVYAPFTGSIEEWEDYEEPKEIWYIDFQGIVRSASKEENDWFKENEIGNCFETKEEAENAVEKLKAWKRLKDKGFKFEGWKRDKRYCGDFTIEATDQISCDDKDLDLLFGSEEDTDIFGEEVLEEGFLGGEE